MNTDSTRERRVAVFFDLDGTLIPEPSLERRFFCALQRAGAIPFANYLRWGVEALRLLPGGVVGIQQRNKRYLAGVSRDLAYRHMDSISFFEEGVSQVAWHARQGHEIVLVSGTPEELARLAAMALECELEARNIRVRVRVLATQLAEERCRWTGHLNGEAMFGEAKARAAEKFALEGGLVLRDCHAYGNSPLDRKLLCAVGHAHAVNPGREMAALANEKDWPIWHWFQEKQVASAENSRIAGETQQIEGRA
jgi:phosphoserine phosphatase